MFPLRAGELLETIKFRSRHAYLASKIGIEIPIFLSVDESGSLPVLAKIDSGATFCVFQREHAEALDIQVESGLRVEIRTVAGAFKAYGHSVKLSYYDYAFESTVYFAENYNFTRNVLGLNGWLDKLRFGLIHHESTLFLSEYDD